MGASNAIAAYRLYAGKVPESSMVVLTWMALVSLDDDTEPWWSQGHAVLAEMAMGREPLRPTGDEKADARAREAMERAVERRITPLFGAGAITVTRHSSGRPGSPIHVRYRLWLRQPAPDEMRRVVSRGAPDAKRRARPSGTRRNVSEHPTIFVGAPDENRGAYEYEEYEERDKQQKHPLTVDGTRTGTARASSATTPEDSAVPPEAPEPEAARSASVATIGTPSAPQLSALCHYCFRPGHDTGACPDCASASTPEPAAPEPPATHGPGELPEDQRCQFDKCDTPERPVRAGRRYHLPCEFRQRGDGGHAA
jgi:hypothetical protein